MTQVALAKAIKVHEITLARWEWAVMEPSASKLRSLAKALDVSVDELLK